MFIKFWRLHFIINNKTPQSIDKASLNWFEVWSIMARIELSPFNPNIG